MYVSLYIVASPWSRETHHGIATGETGEFLGVHVWSDEMLAAAGGDFMYIKVGYIQRE